MPEPLGGFAYTWPYYVAAIGGYLIGSIPFGLILTRLAGLGDIRAIGSGNIGATNVLRTGSKGLAALTLVLDMAKGAVAVLLGAHYGPDTAVLAGGGAVIGHIAPIWLGFKGGKGVATALGVLTALAWPVGILSAVTWLIVAAVGRISSLAALIAIGAAPIYAYLLVDPQRAELALFIAVLVWVRHYENIRRLLKGQEPRIGGLKG
jgi:acyl phosphate:glycerol-3-phosphate acyltransferase